MKDSMKDSNQRKKVLKEMLESCDFEHLSVFEDSSQWEEMPEDERELLGLLYVMQGEKQLVEGDNQVLDSFKRANLVAPNCPQIMYRQALAFSKQTHNVYCLKAAGKIFQKTVEADPGFFDAWHGWANANVLLAIQSHLEEDYLSALEIFKKAEAVKAKAPKGSVSALYRDWGVLWFHYGKFSGEAVDFHHALKCYKKAVFLGMDTHILWSDYGNCLIELATLLKKPELILESACMYWRSIRLKKDFFEGWMNLSTALKLAYELQPTDAYYSLANEGFEQASKLEPDNGALWVKWGQLQAFKGKIFKEEDSLKESIQKFEVANICEPNHPVILSAWAESALYLGEWLEDLKLLREAEEKMITSLELQKDHPKIWCLYGNCLAAIGRYFDDEESYLQAVETYQYGLKLSGKDPEIWHGMALTYLSLGQLKQSVEMLDNAERCCRLAIKHGGKGDPQYWNDWGVILMKKGAVVDDIEIFKGALSKFEQALRICFSSQGREAADPEWLYNYGCALNFLGDFFEDLSFLEKAIQVLKKVTDLDPIFSHAYYNLAIAFAHYGELTSEPDAFKESLKYLEAYVCLEPEDEHAWNEWGLTLIDLAQLIDDPVRRADADVLLAEAEVKFIQARSLGSLITLYHLACLYCLKGKFKEALHFLYRAKDLGVLPPAEELTGNHWLEGIRYTPEFQKLIKEMQNLGSIDF